MQTNMAYLGKSPSQGVRSRYYFTASGGETSISGSLTGGTLTFSDGNYVDVITQLQDYLLYLRLT